MVAQCCAAEVSPVDASATMGAVSDVEGVGAPLRGNRPAGDCEASIAIDRDQLGDVLGTNASIPCPDENLARGRVHQLVANEPDLDERYDFFLWENDPFVLLFTTSCGVSPSDAVAFVKYGTNCPFATDISELHRQWVALSHVGKLNADLRTALALPAGIYQLCLQQAAHASDALMPYVKHPRIRAIANYKTVP